MELWVVYFVTQFRFAELDQRTESMAPKDFGSQIRCARLRGLSRRLRNTLQHYDYFESLVQNVRCTHTVHGTVLVDSMHDHRWPHEKYLFVVVVHTHLKKATGYFILLQAWVRTKSSKRFSTTLSSVENSLFVHFGAQYLICRNNTILINEWLFELWIIVFTYFEY